MKRIGLLLALVFIFGLTSDLLAQRAIKNGFSVNAVLGFPSKSFGAEEDAQDDTQLGPLYGVKLGNRWYFAPQETFGIGLMVNWIDFAFAGKTGTIAGADFTRFAMDLTFAEFGPVGTFAVNDDIGIDGYYNLRPTWLSSAFVTSNIGTSDDEFVYTGFGFSHALGAAFRWKVLNVGFEYVFGSINSAGAYSGDLSGVDLEDLKNKTNSFRIVVGAKF